MDSAEFADWLAYARIEPFGEIRADQRAGVIASAIVNVHKKRGSKPLAWSDFFPLYKDDADKPSGWRGLLALVEGLNSELGGKDKRKKS